MNAGSRRALAALSALVALTPGASGPAAAADARADGPRLDLTNYEMSFEDDFSKPDVVAHGPFSQHAPGMRWTAHTPWNGDFGDARFTDPGPGGPFDFGPEGLTITASKQDDGHWRSGLICSVDRDGDGQGGFTQRYGYFEMRAKLPDGPGTWPAFWLVGVDKSDGSAEVDVLEYYGKYPAGFHTTVHLWKQPTGLHDEHIVDVPDQMLTRDFHDFGVLIGPERMRFFLDRVQFLDIPTPVAFKQPLYMLANLALGGGYPIDRLASPAVMHIAHIRAYRDRTSSP